MKKIIFCFILLGASILYAQNNYNYFKYKLYMNENDEILNDVRFKDYIDRESDTIEYGLFFNESKALFSPIVKLNNSQKSTMMVDLNDVFIKTHGIFYYDEKNKVLENEKTTLGEKFIIESSYSDMNWKLLDETDTINNYVCKKAVLEKKESNNRNYNITVWFTDKFGDNIAPFGLVGLNGLIVKVDFNGNQQLILDELQYKKDIKPIKAFVKGKRISQIEHTKLIDDYMLELKKRRSKSTLIESE